MIPASIERPIRSTRTDVDYRALHKSGEVVPVERSSDNVLTILDTENPTSKAEETKTTKVTEISIRALSIFSACKSNCVITKK